MGEFHFQAPGASKFLQCVNGSASGALGGLGVFAFASAAGVQAFFDALGLGTTWIPPKNFHLIVGVDAITNADALLAISDRVSASGGALTAEVFFHGQAGSTFHPKFVLFTTQAGFRVLTGSGNLTSKGLGQSSTAAFPPGNWEAFFVSDIVGPAAAQQAADIDGWLTAERELGRLRSLNDEAVQARAMANGLLRFTPPGPPAHAVPAGTPPSTVGSPSSWHSTGGWTPAASPPMPVGPSDTEAPLDSGTLVGGDLLIKELPRNRPGQADVGKEILEEFFGYAGVGRTIFLQYVGLDDIVGPTEPIHLFENESRNFRLELRAVAGFPYDLGPSDERIVVVVARLDVRSYRYTVVPVTSAEYWPLSAVLGSTNTGARRLMRSTRLPLASLPTIWPGAPANLRPIIANTPTP